MRSPTLLLSCCLLLTGCSGSDPVATEDLLGQFETVWEDFDRTYPFFIVKGVDWNAERARFRPRVVGATEPRELFDALGEMLLVLEDGHVRLTGPWGVIQYSGWYDRFPHNFDAQVVEDRYTGAGGLAVASGGLRYGTLEDGLGYIHIPSFGGSGYDAGIETALTALEQAPALLIDVRDNGGGSDLNVRAVAGRFADQRRLIRRVRFRDGPGHGDFTPPEEDFIDPSGPHDDRPVGLLTNRRVFSSAETFVLAMREFPQVLVVGDTTGGGSANPAERTLAVGFSYRVSRWIVETADGDVFEGRGLFPDVPVWITPADSAGGRDTILERAMAELEATVTAR